MASIAGPTAAAFYTIHLRARNLRLIGTTARCNFRTRAKLHRRRTPANAPRAPSLAPHALSLSLPISLRRSLSRSRSLEVTRDRAPGTGGHVPGCRYHEKRMSIARSHSSGEGEAAASADFTKLSPLCRPYALKKKRVSRGSESDRGVLYLREIEDELNE